MAERELPVVIAGAGPVGLSLALGLARQGVRSVVLEARMAPSPFSRAPGVLPRTLEILRGWGVIDRFKAEGRFLTTVEPHMPGEPAPLTRLDLSVLADTCAEPGVMILPQDETERLLAEACEATGRVELRRGHRLTGFRQDPDGVEASIETADGSYALRGDYLVGCDGAHSAVRGQLGWELEGKTYPTRVMLADVTFPDDRDPPWPIVSPYHHGLVAAVRLDRRRWRLIGTIEADEPEEAAIEASHLVPRVETLFGPGPFETVWASVFRIHCRTSPHFREGRVFLAGDAAHLNSPVGGQGMNGGIQDAHNLAWKLARAIAGGDAEALLASYEAERRPVVLETIDARTDLATRLALTTGPRTRALLGRIFSRALRWRAFMAWLAPQMGMINHRYAASPLVTGEGPLVGCRAPNLALTDAQGAAFRLHDALMPDALLLLLDDGRMPHWDVAAVERLVAGVPHLIVRRLLPADLTPNEDGWRDATGHGWRLWHGDGGTAALVRPDGFVGWAETRPTAAALAQGVRRALGERGGPAVTFLPAEPGGVAQGE